MSNQNEPISNQVSGFSALSSQESADTRDIQSEQDDQKDQKDLAISTGNLAFMLYSVNIESVQRHLAEVQGVNVAQQLGQTNPV